VHVEDEIKLVHVPRLQNIVNIVKWFNAHI